MALEAEQVEAFTTASGGLEPEALWEAIALIAMTFMLLWLAWVAWSHFQAWRSGQAEPFQFLSAVIWAAIWTLVLGWVVTPA
jgi:integrating conjugative element protein (TIGR03758 family)